MKKLGNFGLGLIAVALAYEALMWFIGMRVESAIAKQYEQLKESSQIKVVQRAYDRGVYSSDETVTLEIPGAMASLVSDQISAPPPNTSQTAGTTVEPLRITLHSRIKHGPFVGSRFAMAEVNTEWVLDSALADLQTLFGSKKPLTIQTLVGFGGAGTAHLLSPSVTKVLKKAGGTREISWSGAKGKIHFNSKLSHFEVQAVAPKLSIKTSDGMQSVIAGVRYEANQTRIAAIEPTLLSGTQQLRIARFERTDGGKGSQAEPLSMKDLTFDFDMPFADDFVDVSGKLAISSLRFGGQEYGPVHYDFSADHLDARKVAAFTKALSRFQSEPALWPRAGEDPMVVLTPVLGDAAFDLLKDNAEFRLNRASLHTTHGKAAISASARIKSTKPEELTNMLVVMSKLEGAADISVPEPFVRTLLAVMSSTPPQPTSATGAVEAQLEKAIANGSIIREQGFLKTHLNYQAGQTTANSVPVELATWLDSEKDDKDEALFAAGESPPSKDDLFDLRSALEKSEPAVAVAKQEVIKPVKQTRHLAVAAPKVSHPVVKVAAKAIKTTVAEHKPVTLLKRAVAVTKGEKKKTVKCNCVRYVYFRIPATVTKAGKSGALKRVKAAPTAKSVKASNTVTRTKAVAAAVHPAAAKQTARTDKKRKDSDQKLASKTALKKSAPKLARR